MTSVRSVRKTMPTTRRHRNQDDPPHTLLNPFMRVKAIGETCHPNSRSTNGTGFMGIARPVLNQTRLRRLTPQKPWQRSSDAHSHEECNPHKQLLGGNGRNNQGIPELTVCQSADSKAGAQRLARSEVILPHYCHFGGSDHTGKRFSGFSFKTIARSIFCSYQVKDSTSGQE